MSAYSMFFYPILITGRIIFTAYSVDVNIFFTAYSVEVEYFLTHTPQAWNIFYRILSRRVLILKTALHCQLNRLRRIFTPYSVHKGDVLPHTQYTQEIFSACSVHIGDSLLHTQYTQNNFYRILSRQGIIFTAQSVIGKKTK